MESEGFVYGVDDLVRRTGLARKFIQRCNAELANVLDPYRMTGENNKFLYNSSGLFVFDEIARLKSNGARMADIRQHLSSDLGKPGSRMETLEEVAETRRAGEAPTASEEVRDAYERVIEAKDETIRITREAGERLVSEKAAQVEVLQQQVRLLTDGRTIEEVRAEKKERRARHTRRVTLLANLRETKGLFQTRRRAQLIHNLSALDDGVGE